MTGTRLQLDGHAWKTMVIAAADAVERQVDELSRLDAVVGDGDHGVNVVTALRFARSELNTAEDLVPADAMKTLARGFLDEMGGAAGALFGSLFRVMGRSFGEAKATDAALFAEGLSGGVETVMRRGQTSPGDKTMVDALAPAATAATESAQGGNAVVDALAAAAALSLIHI